MIYRLTRPVSPLTASVVLPASKSISNRLLIIHALSRDAGGLENLSDSDDTQLLSQALASTSTIKDVGHAGTSMRFLTAYYSIQPETITMTGSERMKQRPIGALVEALRLLGAQISYLENEGFPPLEIHGTNLNGGEINIDGSISSQFISALLMVAPYMKNGLKMQMKGTIVSASYIKMTLELMQRYGASYSWKEKAITVFPGEYEKGSYRVESDWSAASFWYAISLLGPHPAIKLGQLHEKSLQGDSVLVEIFSELGLLSEFERENITISRMADIAPSQFSYDFTNCPDLVQSMAVALCMASIPFRFTGTQTLRIKETDRIAALQSELKKLGYLLDSDPEASFLSWNGEMCDPETDPLIETYHDHRMAMAFAEAAMVRDSVRINDPMVVTKSYPRFWEDLRKAGFQVDIV